MIVTTPLQVADATNAQSSTGTDPTSYPSNNVIAIQCTVPLAVAYYLVDVLYSPFKASKINTWADIALSVVLFGLSAANEGAISEHEEISSTIITVVVTLISAALFLIATVQLASKIAEAGTLGIGTIVKAFAAKIAFGIVSLALMGCPPVVLSNEQGNWFKAGIPANQGAQKTLDDQNFVTESDCLARINVDLEDLTDGAGVRTKSWGDIDSFPITKFPPDFELVENGVIWKNNFLQIATSNPAFLGGYDPITETLKIPPGTHDVMYKGQSVWAVLESQTNPISQKFLVKDIVAPNFAAENTAITIPILEPLFPKGAPVPTSLEQKIKDRAIFEDPCTDDVNAPLTLETNLLSPLDNTNAGIFLPKSTTLRIMVAACVRGEVLPL